MIRTALLLLFSLPLTALAAAPVPGDFAWKSSLNFPPGGALYELSTPLVVYRNAVSPLLADVCIFNGHGELVPFSVETTDPSPVKKRALLPLFALPTKPGAADKLSIRVERRQSGEIVSVSQSGSETRTVAYLLDATSLGEPLAALELEWEGNAEGVVERVSVEASNDLDNWWPVATATLAALKRDGSIIEQKQIPLANTKARYLRLVQQESRTAVKLTKAVATLAAGTAEPRRERLVLAAIPVSGQPGEYLIDTTGRMPVDRVRVLLPETNSIARGTFFSRSSDNEPWVKRQAGTAYRLDLGSGELVSPDLTVPASGDRYWKLKIDETGGGAGAASVKVEVAWAPHRIRFLPRGDAPFVLAYGSGRADTRSVRGADLLASLPTTDPAKVTILRAEAGEATTLGGEAALKQEMPAATRKKLTLWGVLLLGVGLLAWMALRLSRQMKDDNGQ